MPPPSAPYEPRYPASVVHIVHRIYVVCIPPSPSTPSLSMPITGLSDGRWLQFELRRWISLSEPSIWVPTLISWFLWPSQAPTSSQVARIMSFNWGTAIPATSPRSHSIFQPPHPLERRSGHIQVPSHICSMTYRKTSLLRDCTPFISLRRCLLARSHASLVHSGGRNSPGCGTAKKRFGSCH